MSDRISGRSAARRVAVIALAGGLAAGLAACASQPEHNAALDAAHQRLSQLEQDPTVKQYAPTELARGQQSLAAADQAYKDGDTTTFNHQLFMADRSLSTAQAQARDQAAQAQLSQLNQQRDQVLLNSKTAQLQRTEKELQAYKTRETSQGTVVTLYDLPFATGKAELQPGAAVRLQPLVSYLREHPNGQVVVQGNTDSTGSAEVNQRLSQERAEAVRNFLISAGVSPNRVIARGLGSSYPVASNNTAAGRQENRRVDVVIAPPQSTAQLPGAAGAAAPAAQ